MSELTKRNTEKIKNLVILALFSALIIIMNFTPLGFLKIGPVEITFIVIPVAVGAILTGPIGGLVLGGVFGLMSFIQCFGMSVFGTLLFGVNPFFAFLLTMVPRLLTGFLTGLIFRAMNKLLPKLKLVSCIVASISCAILNTLFFVLFFVLLYGSSPDVFEFFGNVSLFKIIFMIVTLNSLIEAGVSCVVGASVSRAIIHFFPAGKKG